MLMGFSLIEFIAKLEFINNIKVAAYYDLEDKVAFERAEYYYGP